MAKPDGKNRDLHLDAAQGEDEERIEAYQEHVEGAPKPSVQDSTKRSGRVGGSAGEQSAAVQVSMEESILYAKKYLEDLLSFFGLNTDVYATNDDDVIELNIPSTHLNGFLIGQRGETMRSLQFIVSNALRNNNYGYTRVNVDVADYKKQRAERLSETAMEWIAKVKSTGKEMPLKPMSAADRRTVHKVANDNGLATESVGEGRDRHIVLKPSDSGDATNNESE